MLFLNNFCQNDSNGMSLCYPIFQYMPFLDMQFMTFLELHILMVVATSSFCFFRHLYLPKLQTNRRQIFSIFPIIILTHLDLRNNLLDVIVRP